MAFIKIKGARVHNLKNINVDIPINKITCIKGPSGSGKSSLAFHTLYSESKRRYLNSMPDSFKFFSERPLKADVDEIVPVLPAFALAQSNPIMTSRSCVVDVMGLIEKLQKVFYFLGQQYCPIHDLSYRPLMPSHLIAKCIRKKKLKKSEIIHIIVGKEVYKDMYGEEAFPVRSFDLNGNRVRDFDASDEFYEVLRFRLEKLNSIDEKQDDFLKLKEGQEVFLFSLRLKKLLGMKYSSQKLCPQCDRTSSENHLQDYSPYNALGACSHCSGHGAILIYDENKIFPNLNLSYAKDGTHIFNYKRIKVFKKKFIKEISSQGYSKETPFKKFNKKTWGIIRHGGDHFPGLDGIFQYLNKKRYKKDVRILLRSLQKEEECSSCRGTRIITEARNTKILYGSKEISFEQVLQGSLKDLAKVLIEIVDDHSSKGVCESHINYLLRSLLSSLRVSFRIGLGGLPLLKKSKSLTPGEYQRLLMVKYLSYEGSGSLFIFDEPSLGLSKIEQNKIFNEIVKLRDQGNTILLVEHARIFHELSDEVIEMGPGAGFEGGEITYQGIVSPHPCIHSQKREVGFVKRRPTSWITIGNVECDHYKKKEIKIPLDCLTQVKGSSDSGKVQMIMGVFPNIVRDHINNIYKRDREYSYEYLKIENEIQDIFVVNSNFGRVTSRSTVGSFLGLSPELRKYYAHLPVSKTLGLMPGNFSVNSVLGRCPVCEGKGLKIIDMVYLEDIRIPCEDCRGRGLKPEYATISDGQFTSYEAFSLPMKKVVVHLKLTAKYRRIWQYIEMLSLDYLSLSRPLNTLSGGERQRINLLSYLTKNINNSLLIFENLSFGLSDKELGQLVALLRQVCSRSNSIVVVDNHDSFGEASDFILNFDKE